MKTKYIAVISLIIMGIGFVTTIFLPQNVWVDLLRGGFEAGLVGGFADWFAVTALFRHPMGIPIPHTSLLLKNRDKIANSLISALENELLNKASITRKLEQLKLLSVFGTIITRLIGKRSNRVGIAAFVQSLLLKLPLELLAPYIQSAIASFVGSTDAASLADKAVHKTFQEGWDEQALDYVLVQGQSWVSRPETGYMLGSMALQKLSEAKVGGLMGFAVQAFSGFMTEEKLGTMIQQLLLSTIQDLHQPSHPNRDALITEIRKQIRRVAEDEALLARGKQWIIDKLQHEDTGTFIRDQMESVRSRLVEALEREKQSGGRTVVKAVRYIMRKLQAESELMARLEQKMLTFIVDFVEANHYRLGVLLKDNLDRMDDKALVKMLEEKVGGDLQWIRVNGALCGFVIGLVLTVIQWL